MGTWDSTPWGNDEAADWYADLMSVTRLRQHWAEGLEASIEDEAATVWAAIGLFVLLGRPHLWPIETFDQDLERCFERAEALRSSPQLTEDPDFETGLEGAIAELEGRRRPAPDPDAKRTPAGRPWWKFWYWLD